MISSDDVKELARRWKRAALPLNIEDQKYGIYLSELIERNNWRACERCKESLEAAAFIVLTQIVKDEMIKNGEFL